MKKREKENHGKESPSASTSSSIAGTWSYTIDLPDQKKKAPWSLRKRWIHHRHNT
ncbi:MAG: hypothetical protein IPP15_12765 [Saprospiraceae bacterium]|uniref:Uncharacterized protein n=1 Tax=Candidatus Opimibacter skivensis TaxID=2982028 RepID=A0A9D7SW60_9BACT|nr:hypothetical protein [Candidatus Opimibacter skivensis]